MPDNKFGCTQRERLLSRLLIDQETGCVIWTGSLDRDGYGLAWADGRTRRIHRVIYETLAGPIPDGLTLDHLCQNKACCSPAHLEPVTVRENILRSTGPAAVNFAKTRCPKGHLYDRANTFWRQSGARLCRICHREGIRRRRRARKLAATISP